jgi:hypothetical protein
MIPEYDISKIKFSFDLSQAEYKVDALQTKLIQFYLRADKIFRRAYYNNLTNDFLQFLKDKAELREPTPISISGTTRSGKSSITSTMGFLHQAFYKKRFWVDYICGNEIEYLEKLKSMTEEETTDAFFQIDEDKQGTFGVGSVAKKMKMLDVQNITAKRNITAVSLCPTRFSNPNALYGLRVFGKCYKTMTNRLMLYDLQESKMGKPMGMVYFPIPKAILPKNIYEQFNREYEKKKDDWISKELTEGQDVMGGHKKDVAKQFLRDRVYLGIKTKSEKKTYISIKLGSEYTKGECEEIYYLTSLMDSGIDL